MASTYLLRQTLSCIPSASYPTPRFLAPVTPSPITSGGRMPFTLLPFLFSFLFDERQIIHICKPQLVILCMHFCLIPVCPVLSCYYLSSSLKEVLNGVPWRDLRQHLPFGKSIFRKDQWQLEEGFHQPRLNHQRGFL